MKGNFDFDSAIDYACELAGNSEGFRISGELPLPDSTSTIPTDEPYSSHSDPDENWPMTES
jgi:ribosomal protein S10